MKHIWWTEIFTPEIGCPRKTESDYRPTFNCFTNLRARIGGLFALQSSGIRTSPHGKRYLPTLRTSAIQRPLPLISPPCSGPASPAAIVQLRHCTVEYDVLQHLPSVTLQLSAKSRARLFAAKWLPEKVNRLVRSGFTVLHWRCTQSQSANHGSVK